MRGLLTVLTLWALMACSRGDSDGTAAPLPTAWPRVAVYDTLYAPVSGLSVNIEVNTGANTTVKAGENPGVDIAYPRYGVTVYLTVVRGLNKRADFEQVWRARRERIDTNTGGTAVDVAAVYAGPPGAETSYNGALVIARSASQTPVQLLAGCVSAGTVVTATAFVHAPVDAAALDSIAPVVDAVAADLRHLAENLR